MTARERIKDKGSKIALELQLIINHDHLALHTHMLSDPKRLRAGARVISPIVRNLGRP
jgi:hypothetical protein